MSPSSPWPDAQRVDVEVLDERRHLLGEGARWDGSSYWQVDLLGGVAFRGDGRGPLQPFADTSALGQAVDQYGAQVPVPIGVVLPLYAGATATDQPEAHVATVGTGVALLRDGVLTTVATIEAGPGPQFRVNDANAVFGTLFVGTMSWGAEPGQGGLWRLREGVFDQVVGGMLCPNGPVFSPDGAWMYLVESGRAEISRIALHDPEGACELGRSDLFARIPEGLGLPDGMAVDDDECLWVALWDGHAIVRFAPDGRVLGRYAVPAARPTSVALLGDAVMVTSARLDLAEPGPYDGATMRLDLPVGGPTAGAVRLPG